MIELTGVTKLYNTVIGVNDITLSLSPGVYGLLGPNGAGKTTLINLITGQLSPTLGTARVFDTVPRRNESILRRIGLCPAVDVLYRNVSGLAWVRYLVELHGHRRSEAARRAKEALDKVGMGAAMDRPMRTYSLGMRQRTKIAQAIAHDPDLLILDEPFNGLDPVGRHEMVELLKHWHEPGCGLIFASHILHEVEAISPSFLLISGGRLLASGTAEEVHSLLDEIPDRITVRCDRPVDLARRLVDDDSIDSLHFEGSQCLVVSTGNPRAIYDRLPALIRETNIRVSELKSQDDSLQALFGSLMRIHRGES